MKKKDNIVLFPTWKRKIESDLIQALEDESYERALHLLEQLSEYGQLTDQQEMNRLICHMQLGNYFEAQSICEGLLIKHSEHYYDVLNIYVSVLFQTDQHQLLQDTVQETIELQSLPHLVKEQLEFVAKMSAEEMKSQQKKQIKFYMNQFEAALATNDYTKQWQLLESMRRLKQEPKEKILSLLTETSIHPAVKTSIVLWIKQEEYPEAFSLLKFNVKEEFLIKDLYSIRKSEAMMSILNGLAEIEQSNPSLFILLNQLLYRFIYILYPFAPKEADYPVIIRALKNIGSDLLGEVANKTERDDVLAYEEQIKQCEALYLSVIQE